MLLLRYITFGALGLALTACSSGNNANNDNGSSFCSNQVCNFNYALRNESTSLFGIPTGLDCGPQAQPLSFDPSLTQYLESATWQQNRILAAIAMRVLVTATAAIFRFLRVMVNMNQLPLPTKC